jgi:hypothetical protein
MKRWRLAGVHRQMSRSLLSHRSKRRFALLVVSVGFVLTLVVGWLMLSQRRLNEQHYLNFVETDYLPALRESEGKWPSSLDQFERVVDTRVRSQEMRRIYLDVHRTSRPLLRVIRADTAHFEGELVMQSGFGGKLRVYASIR